MRIVRRRHAAICSTESPADRPQDLRRKATAATAQPLRTTTAALTSRPSARTETRRPTAINALRTTGALTISRSGCNVTPRPTTATVAIRSRALTTRRPHARTRRRKLIPHQAAAIQLRRAPTLHRAAAIRLRQALTLHRATARAEEAAVVGVAVAAETRTAAEAPPLAGGTNPFSNSVARPDLPGGPFVFRHQLKFPRPYISRVSSFSWHCALTTLPAGRC